MNSVRILFFCGVLVASTFASEKCHIAFPTRGAAFRPLVYNADETELLLENHEGVMNVAEGNSVLFTCKQYEFSGETEHKIIALCKGGQLLDANGEIIVPSEISCQLRVVELSPRTSPKCSSSLAQYEFYNKGSEEKSIVAETCYDLARNIPIYSHYKVSSPPQFIENTGDLAEAPFMSAVDILAAYRSDEINRKVTKILGDGHIRSDNVLYSVSLIPKEHVHGQFRDVSRRAHNLFTMWDNVLYGNYENLVQDVRKLRKNSRVFDVYSGVSETATRLTNTKDKLVDLYLQTKRTSRSFPVPEFYWAVVYEKQTQKGVAFVIRNDLEGSKTDPICNSICQELSWANNLRLNNNYMNVQLGQTTCCDLKDFRRVVSHVPIINDIVVNDGTEGLLKE